MAGGEGHQGHGTRELQVKTLSFLRSHLLLSPPCFLLKDVSPPHTHLLPCSPTVACMMFHPGAAWACVGF